MSLGPGVVLQGPGHSAAHHQRRKPNACVRKKELRLPTSHADLDKVYFLGFRNKVDQKFFQTLICLEAVIHNSAQDLHYLHPLMPLINQTIHLNQLSFLSPALSEYLPLGQLHRLPATLPSHPGTLPCFFLCISLSLYQLRRSSERRCQGQFLSLTLQRLA